MLSYSFNYLSYCNLTSIMRKIVFALLTLLVCFINIQAQSFDSTLAKIAAGYQPEKVYLHYDKSSYYAGETIWFKGYLMAGIFPATETKTLYVDWISDNGSVLLHTVSPIVDAVTNGQFEVPSNYSGNFVHVRAYTKWMLNFDTAFLYSKDIQIIPKDPFITKTPIAIIPSLQFFPEGGDIIAGIKNRIAFKANDQYGRPVSIKAKLYDDKGSMLQSFSSVHDGMGSFFLQPKEGSNYTIKWTDEKNMEHSSSLPQIKQAGIAMQVTIENKKRVISLIGTSQLPGSLQQLHLIGTMSQTLVFKTDVQLNETNSARRIIPTDHLPTGILTITLFDAGWNAIAERITFINNNDYSFQPQMEVQRWGLGKRKRNEIEIRVPDSLQNANLSIAVTDAAIEKDTSDNIVSNFLLTSEIRGKVFNAAYYFSNNSDSVAQHLDLVMLTNGWRRFKWEDVVKGKLPEINYPKDTSYLTLSGKVFGVAKNQLSGRESIALLIKEKDSSTKFLMMNINSDGSFGDPNIVLFDTLKVYYSLKAKFLKAAEARFMTDRLPAPSYISFARNFVNSKTIFDTTGTYHHSLLASKSLEIMNIDRGQIMKTVVITATKKPPVKVLDEKYTSGLFKGEDAYQFDLVNDPASTGYPDIFSYLQGRVAGLQINTTTSPPSFSWRGSSSVAVFLDEMQTDADMISTVPVSDIAYVKVFRPPFIGAVGGGSGGAIAIYTRKGSDQTSSKGGLSSNTVAGYTPIKQFYSPNYDAFDPRNDHLDIRTTLYWNPLLSTTENKKTIKLSFHNNDVTKSFRVVIEGMTRDGLLTHYEQIME
jgi:hypothetical protein